MRVARHGRGVRATLEAVGSQIHPIFMLPPLATSLFGGVLAGHLDHVLALLHVTAMFFAVYTAHVKDGYVDFHIRGEDDDHPLTVTGCRLALVGSTVGFILTTAALAILATPITAAFTIPTWLIAYNHAPTLDIHAATTTLGYPTGIALALLGGYHAQAGSISLESITVAVIFLALLAGIKIIDDSKDYVYDRSIQKRTVAVVLGPAHARTVAFGILGLSLIGTLVAVAVGLIPVGATLAVVAFAVVAGFAWRGDPETATMLLVRGSYVFLAVLVAAIWFRPLQ